MNLHKRFLRVRRLISCVSLVLISVVASSAQSEKTFSLSEFNPVGNGVADDGPAFQKAFDALAAAGGGKLLIPAGSYKILTPVKKDFSSVSGAKVVIQGVPSTKMPAPVTATGNVLAEGLDLTSEIIPATGKLESAFVIRNLDSFLIEHVGFTGIESSETDAFTTLYFIDIDKATIRHCEFYGLSTFGNLPEEGGGNLVRAIRSDLSIELTVFLGCTGNSGAYAALVENIQWKKFSISNSIFLDYGLRAFFSKTGIGAPLSWINIGNAAEPTPDSPRREILVKDVFLDEGGWVGISALPYRYTPFKTLPDLIYISGLKMNVPNMGTAGHLLYDGKNLLIENSQYVWSRNAYAALHINRFENVILDKLNFAAPSFNANRIVTDDLTGRLTVINSNQSELVSQAAKISVLQTAAEDDPVQYVRTQFMTALGKQPDPAAHFYWSDLLIRCESNADCLNEKRALLSEYLSRGPNANFALRGTITDENNDPLSGVAISLTGSQTTSAQTDAQGKFQFSNLPTSGIYTVTVNKPHCTFVITNKTVVHPATDVSADFNGRLNRHTITGRLTRLSGAAMSGVTLQLAQSPSTTVTTDSNGFFTFAGLEAGGSYTVVPLMSDFVFAPANLSFDDLSANATANFTGKLEPELIMSEGSEFAVALDSGSFVMQPFSLFNSLGFGTDGFMRVMIFATNLEPVSSLSQISVAAKDDQGTTHPLEVEFLGEVPGQSWLRQLNIKVPANTLGGKCVQLKLTIAEVSSNQGRLCIR